MRKYYVRLFYVNCCTPKTMKVSKLFFKREFRDRLNTVRSYYDSGWQRMDVSILKLKKAENVSALFIYKAD